MPKGNIHLRNGAELLRLKKWCPDEAANPEMLKHMFIYVGDGGPRFYLATQPGQIPNRRVLSCLSIQSDF